MRTCLERLFFFIMPRWRQCAHKHCIFSSDCFHAESGVEKWSAARCCATPFVVESYIVFEQLSNAQVNPPSDPLAGSGFGSSALAVALSLPI